jgi:hypothetical protein
MTYRLHLTFPDGDELVTTPRPDTERLIEAVQFVYEENFPGVDMRLERQPNEQRTVECDPRRHLDHGPAVAGGAGA